MHDETGTAVAGRYVLEHRLVDATHVTLWRGHDTVLDRPVSVRLVEASHPRASDVLDAARSTTRVDDLRVARVLDADVLGDDLADLPGAVYVVTAWAGDTDLASLLADGPLDVDEALALVAELAEVLAVTHDLGVAHLALSPGDVVVGQAGEVTLLGLAVDAVLWGGTGPTSGDDDATADARGLGALLYASLTARWPGDPADAAGLRLAPRLGSRLCTPGQVRAAVPSAVDVVCRRALGEPVGGGTLDCPADLAAAMLAVADDRGRARWRPSSWFGRSARTAAR